jgi:serine/threonine protein kinase
VRVEEKETIHTPKYVLADFGLCELIDPLTGTCIASSGDKYTWPFRPPEAKSKKYTAASDIWALGVTFLELFDVDLLGGYEEKEYLKQLQKWSLNEEEFRKMLVNKMKNIPENFREIILAMLILYPEKRSNANKLLESSLFEKLRLFEQPKCDIYRVTNKSVRDNLKREYHLPRDVLTMYYSYPSFTPYDVCNVIDLFYMSCFLLEEDTKITEFSLLLTCILMIDKFRFFGSPDKLSDLTQKRHFGEKDKIPLDEFFRIERVILERLGGAIHRRSYYNYMVSYNLLVAFVTLIRSSTTYLKYDQASEWYTEVTTQPGYLSGGEISIFLDTKFFIQLIEV